VLLDSAPDDPRAYSMVLTHLFGTARMSVRLEDGVVGTDFAVHGIRNLHVVDSSIFPTNTGVNPQLSIMGIAMLAAERIADRAA
jgi:choline dehydrogenase-like flavoprotein